MLILILIGGILPAPSSARQSDPPPLTFHQTDLLGETITTPTSLDFGPDNRLYVVEQYGTIYAYTVQRTCCKSYFITDTEIITAIRDIPNHNDDGSSTGVPVSERQVTGLLATGTREHPVLYVTSSDPRRTASEDSNLDTNSGMISRLTWTGSAWEMVHVVRGLPRSEEYHSTNGLTLDPRTRTLYVAQGGNTNMGAPGKNFSYTPEYALSGAILSVDLRVIEALPVQVDSEGQSYLYDLPTLDDPTRGTPGEPDPGDPFGGNDGLNQAVIVPGGPVQVYAPGFRNPFDVVLTQSTHRLYTLDNGPNELIGGRPVNEVNCTNDASEAGNATLGDNLHYITGPGYYGGHPNPTRANPDNAKLYRYERINGMEILQGLYDFTPDWTPVPFDLANPVECDYRAPADEDGIDGIDDGSLTSILASTNGLAEYTASNFANTMQGNLLAASFNGYIYRFVLSEDGASLALEEVLFSGLGIYPLDLTIQGDADIFPGTVWVATFASNNITIFEPADFIG